LEWPLNVGELWNVWRCVAVDDYMKICDGWKSDWSGRTRVNVYMTATPFASLWVLLFRSQNTRPLFWVYEGPSWLKLEYYDLAYWFGGKVTRWLLWRHLFKIASHILLHPAPSFRGHFFPCYNYVYESLLLCAQVLWSILGFSVFPSFELFLRDLSFHFLRQGPSRVASPVSWVIYLHAYRSMFPPVSSISLQSSCLETFFVPPCAILLVLVSSLLWVFGGCCPFGCWSLGRVKDVLQDRAGHSLLWSFSDSVLLLLLSSVAGRVESNIHNVSYPASHTIE